MKKNTGKIAICIDMDDTINEYAKYKKEKEIEDPTVVYPQSQKKFFYNIPLKKDAKEIIKYLSEQGIFEIFFLTAPSLKNPHCFTEKFLSIQRDFWDKLAKNLCIYSDKSAFYPLDKSNPENPKNFIKTYLIDDYKEWKWQEKFRGEVLHFGEKNTYPDWKSIKEYFDKNYIKNYIKNLGNKKTN